MSATQDVAQVIGLGERLAQARERRGLALVQAAEKLHLEPRVLEALEAENFEALGASVYVRGHLQRYAELVGENASELLALYAARPHAHATPDLTRVITERGRGAVPGARFGVWRAGLLTLALVLAALIWWAMRSGPIKTSTTVVLLPAGTSAGAAQPSAASQAAEAAAPILAPPRGAPVSTSAAAGHESSSAVRSGRPAVAVVPATTSPAAVRASEPKPAAPAASAAVPAATATAPSEAAPAAHEANLVLRFREDSWAEVYEASGAALFRDIATAGTVKTLSGVPPLRLVLGNAAAVGISLNGRNVTLGAALQSAPNARFALDRGGRVTETP
jgi:cytoskeleton protein RodZ